MAKDALGLVETRGLAAALEASDAAAKAADIIVAEIEIPSAGVCTVKIRGEVADVFAAVEAGVAAAGRVGEVVGHHVIPRPDPSVEEFLMTKKIVLSDTGGSPNAYIRKKKEPKKAKTDKS